MASILKELKKEKQDLKAVYILVGQDNFTMEIFAKKFIEKVLEANISMNSIKIFEEAEDALRRLEEATSTMTMWGGEKVIQFFPQYVLKGRLKGEFEDRFLDIIKERKPGIYFLIMAGENIDRRSRAYKRVSQMGAVLKAEPLQGKELRAWIMNKACINGKKIDEEGLTFLEYAFFNHLYYLENELKKIFLYTGDKKEISVSDIKEIVSRDRVLHDKIIFDWVDIISRGKVSQALELMGEMLMAGVNEVYLFTMLVRQIRLLALSWEMQKKGLNYTQAAKKLGEHPFPIKKCYTTVNRLSRAELEYVWLKALEANVQVVSGDAGWRQALEVLLLQWQEYKAKNN